MGYIFRGLDDKLRMFYYGVFNHYDAIVYITDRNIFMASELERKALMFVDFLIFLWLWEKISNMSENFLCFILPKTYFNSQCKHSLEACPNITQEPYMSQSNIVQDISRW